MIVSIIVAIANNNAIGKDNDLLWHLPADMKFFRETTTGHHIITGRKNYESIPEKFRPLKDRTNIIVTRNNSLDYPGSLITHSIEEAIELAKKTNETEAFIIGGGEIYRQSMNLADRLYITHVDTEFPDADTFFPELNDDWKIITERKQPADDKNQYNMTFRVYER